MDDGNGTASSAYLNGDFSSYNGESSYQLGVEFGAGIQIELFPESTENVQITQDEFLSLNNAASELQAQINVMPPTVVVVPTQAQQGNNTIETANVKHSKYFVNSNSLRIISLKSQPSIGDIVEVYDAGNTAASSQIIVTPAGYKINNSNQSAFINTNGGSAVFTYTGTAFGWKKVTTS
jgi:hypothetical protein